MRKIYIRAAEQISMQQPLSEEWMTEPRRCDEPFVRATDPAFREYIAPNEARRMATIIKRALTTSLKVLRATGVEHPDAIITGTCYGCLDYTDRFLADMVANGEQQMSPTHFMQSTHNTIGSAIGISTKSHGYNTTYSHGSASFALAVQDAWMQMQLGRIGTALVGAHDEMFESFFRLMQKAGYVGREGMVPCGEASMTMLLDTTAHPDDLCELCGIWNGHHPSMETMRQALDQLLQNAGMTLADVDAVMLGENGDPENDVHYSRLADALLPHIARLQYKQLFGENMSVSALGLYAAAHCLAKGTIPASLCPEMEGQKPSVAPQCILWVNQMQGYDYSFVLLKKATC